MSNHYYWPIDIEQVTPSLTQAQSMKYLRRNGDINVDVYPEIMMNQKTPLRNDITLSGKISENTFHNYAPLSK